jgi:hypothetical protein
MKRRTHTNISFQCHKRPIEMDQIVIWIILLGARAQNINNHSSSVKKKKSHIWKCRNIFPASLYHWIWLKTTDMGMECQFHDSMVILRIVSDRQRADWSSIGTWRHDVWMAEESASSKPGGAKNGREEGRREFRKNVCRISNSNWQLSTDICQTDPQSAYHQEHELTLEVHFRNLAGQIIGIRSKSRFREFCWKIDACLAVELFKKVCMKYYLYYNWFISLDRFHFLQSLYESAIYKGRFPLFDDSLLYQKTSGLYVENY